MGTLDKVKIKTMVTQVIAGKDYRIVVQNAIATEFLNFCLNFFKQVVAAKIHSKSIDLDWYKKTFVQDYSLRKEDIAYNAGINMKTITNMYRTSKREIVLQVAEENYDTLTVLIENLIETEPSLDIDLTIKFGKVSVELNLNETLIVINSLAVKRAAIRGGSYSAAGKNVEGPLMLVLCKLFSVDERYYSYSHKDGNRLVDSLIEREVDFFLKNDRHVFKCEVKLMGAGNSESADAVIARESRVFVADTLSQNNKNQLDMLGVEWVCLRDKNGWKRFGQALRALKIPHTVPINLQRLDQIVDEII